MKSKIIQWLKIHGIAWIEIASENDERRTWYVYLMDAPGTKQGSVSAAQLAKLKIDCPEFQYLGWDEKGVYLHFIFEE